MPLIKPTTLKPVLPAFNVTQYNYSTSQQPIEDTLRIKLSFIWKVRGTLSRLSYGTGNCCSCVCSLKQFWLSRVELLCSRAIPDRTSAQFEPHICSRRETRNRRLPSPLAPLSTSVLRQAHNKTNPWGGVPRRQFYVLEPPVGQDGHMRMTSTKGAEYFRHRCNSLVPPSPKS